ncbi:hypothetical protein LG315_13025 [Microbacterium marinum]|uniref:hypothetical protein n=1 Tax=Microbacterium marinum TaxID=421115 RepID=UPI00384A61C8
MTCGVVTRKFAWYRSRAIERFLPKYEAAGWEILPEVIEGTRHGYRIIASHYPYAGDSQEQDRHTSHRPRWEDGIPLIHGHTHARDHGPNGHQFHAGVDAHDFAPIPFSVIDDWIQSLPGIETRLETAVREAREVIADLDDTPPSNMDLMFFMQAYDELHMHLEELLEALRSQTSPERRSS